MNPNPVATKQRLYGTSLALLTDLYQLTMAYAHWKAGTADKEGVFNLFFRKPPFDSGFTIACGLEPTIDFIRDFRYDDSDLTCIAELRGNDDRPLFEDKFLGYLGGVRIEADIDAVPEGTVLFPHEPMYRVRGPIIQGTLCETPFLTINGFPTLVATKAARVKIAANGEPVLDFGLRRAQGIDGALAASRAAYIGGADATSNVLAHKLYGIPCKGTHAHAWVMSFDDELEAFQAYAEAMPNNCVFLVDTYDTIEGVKKAIEVGKWLRSKGFEMIGVRLDSGDLAYLSKQARKLLDREGFPNAKVFASNDLDETIIASLKGQRAQIRVWGVGTKLITAFDQPALGCVYKLSAWRRKLEAWHHCVKLSEQAIKVSNPGIQQVRRFLSRGKFAADMIFNEEHPPVGRAVMVDPMDMTRRKVMGKNAQYQDLLVPITRGSSVVYQTPALTDIRVYREAQLAGLHEGIKRQLHPHQYPVGLEQGLADLKTDLILKARGLKK